LLKNVLENAKKDIDIVACADKQTTIASFIP